MAFRRVIDTILLFVFFTKAANGVVQIDIAEIDINFGNQINNFLPNCFGVDLEFFLQLSTSNYSSQTTYFIQQQDAKSYSVALTNTSSFQIPSTTDFISLTGILSMRCSVSPAPFSDSFLIQSQTNAPPDGNNLQVVTNVKSSVNSWSLTTTLLRRCTGTNQYGFNCNEQCTATDDGYHCYTCGSNGQKVCCNSGDVNPNDCTYYNQPASTTWSPNVQCSQSAENTYFWLMISFAIIIAILAIFLLLAVLELCFGIFTAQKGPRSKGSEDRDWIVQNEPRANRELYDGDINRNQSHQRNGESRNSNDRDHSRARSPYFVNREGLDNQTYDEDSLRNQWVEPQPRRVARV